MMAAAGGSGVLQGALVPAAPSPPAAPASTGAAAPAASTGAGRRRRRSEFEGTAIANENEMYAQLLHLTHRETRTTKLMFRTQLQGAAEAVRRWIDEQAVPDARIAVLQVLATTLSEVAQQGSQGSGVLYNHVTNAYKQLLATALRSVGFVPQPPPGVDDALSLREQEELVGFVDSEPDPSADDLSSGYPTGTEQEQEQDAAAAAQAAHAAHAEFLHFSPTALNDQDYPEVRQAYGMITHPQHGFAHSIYFDLVPMLRRVYDNISEGRQRLRDMHWGVLDASETKLMLGGGRCQSQKTPLKVVQILMCRLLGVATIVLTTNVSGREDLFRKFTTFLSPGLGNASLMSDPSHGGHEGIITQLNAPPPAGAGFAPGGTPMRQRFRYERHRKRNRQTGQMEWVIELMPYTGTAATAATDPLSEPIIINIADIAPKHYDWVADKLLKGACLVVNNTQAAIDKASNLVRNTRGEANGQTPFLQFCVTIDEADDFIRTDSYLGPSASNPAILLERAVQRLCSYGPLIKFNVTATLLAIYLMLLRMHRAGISQSVQRIRAPDIVYIQPRCASCTSNPHRLSCACIACTHRSHCLPIPVCAALRTSALKRSSRWRGMAHHFS